MIMNDEILNYLRRLRLLVASSTYRRKSWEVLAFSKWMEKAKSPLPEAKQVDVEAFLLSIDASSRFRRSVCATIRDLFTFLRVPENPAAKIVFKHDDSYRLPSVPSRAAVDEIFARLAGDGDDLRIRDRLMVELAYGSGLRRDELRKVNAEDVDFEGQTIRVTGKGNKVRIVPVTTKTASTARMYLARRCVTRGPLLLSYAGRRLSAQGVYSIMRERVGIRPHLLRHACATHMLANGAGIRMIQELLGHADLKATQIYTHLEKSDLRRVVLTRHPRANFIEK
jgi:site-specific recombinase XerD